MSLRDRVLQLFVVASLAMSLTVTGMALPASTLSRALAQDDAAGAGGTERPGDLPVEISVEDQRYLFDRTVLIDPSLLQLVAQSGDLEILALTPAGPFDSVYVTVGDDAATELARYLPERLGDPDAQCLAEEATSGPIQDAEGNLYVSAGPERDIVAAQLTQLGTTADNRIIYVSGDAPYEELFLETADGLERLILVDDQLLPVTFENEIVFAGQSFSFVGNVAGQVDPAAQTKVGCLLAFPALADPATGQGPFASIFVTVGDSLLQFEATGEVEAPPTGAPSSPTADSAQATEAPIVPAETPSVVAETPAGETPTLPVGAADTPSVVAESPTAPIEPAAETPTVAADAAVQVPEGDLEAFPRPIVVAGSFYTRDRLITIDVQTLVQVETQGEFTIYASSDQQPANIIYVASAAGGNSLVRYVLQGVGQAGISCLSEGASFGVFSAGDAGSFAFAGIETDITVEQLQEIGAAGEGQIVYSGGEQPLEEVFISSDQGLLRFVHLTDQQFPESLTGEVPFGEQAFTFGQEATGPDPASLTKVGCAGPYPAFADASAAIAPYTQIYISVGARFFLFTATEAPAPAVTDTPAASPTDVPTETPAASPTDVPTDTPAASPTDVPTDTPTASPTDVPTDTPAASPTDVPTDTPAASPTDVPTETPAASPTDVPTVTPTEVPTETPAASPTDVPTEIPTTAATGVPTEASTSAATEAPTEASAEVATTQIDLGDFEQQITVVQNFYFLDRSITVDIQNLVQIDVQGDLTYYAATDEDSPDVIYVSVAGSNTVVRYLLQGVDQTEVRCLSEAASFGVFTAGDAGSFAFAGIETEIDEDELVEVGSAGQGQTVYSGGEEPIAEVFITSDQGLLRFIRLNDQLIPESMTGEVPFGTQVFTFDSEATGVQREGLTKVGCVGPFPVYAEPDVDTSPFTQIYIYVGTRLLILIATEVPATVATTAPVAATEAATQAATVAAADEPTPSQVPPTASQAPAQATATQVPPTPAVPPTQVPPTAVVVVFQPPAVVPTYPPQAPPPAAATSQPTNRCAGDVGGLTGAGLPERLPRSIQLNGISYRFVETATVSDAGSLSRISCVGPFVAVRSDRFEVNQTIFLSVSVSSSVQEVTIYRYNAVTTFNVQFEVTGDPRVITIGANPDAPDAQYGLINTWSRSIYSSVSVILYTEDPEATDPDRIYARDVNSDVVAEYVPEGEIQQATDELAQQANGLGINPDLVIAGGTRYILVELWLAAGTTTNGWVTLYSAGDEGIGDRLLGYDPRRVDLLIFEVRAS